MPESLNCNRDSPKYEYGNCSGRERRNQAPGFVRRFGHTPGILSGLRKTGPVLTDPPENCLAEALVGSPAPRYFKIRVFGQPLGMDLTHIDENATALATLFQM
jgi:hypothetical protein